MKGFRKIIALMCVFVTVFQMSFFVYANNVTEDFDDEYSSVVLSGWDAFCLNLIGLAGKVDSTVGSAIEIDDLSLLSNLAQSVAYIINWDTFCPYSEDGYHHADSIIGCDVRCTEAGESYVVVTCQECDQDFTVFSDLLIDAYDDYVTTLAGTKALEFHCTDYTTPFSGDFHVSGWEEDLTVDISDDAGFDGLVATFNNHDFTNGDASFSTGPLSLGDGVYTFSATFAMTYPYSTWWEYTNSGLYLYRYDPADDSFTQLKSHSVCLNSESELLENGIYGFSVDWEFSAVSNCQYYIFFGGRWSAPGLDYSSMIGLKESCLSVSDLVCNVLEVLFLLPVILSKRSMFSL